MTPKYKMKNMKISFIFLGVFISCNTVSQKNPAVMFSELFEKYKTTEFESRRIEGGPEDGMGILIFDVNKKLSNDLFCKFTLYASMGQTRYLIYKKHGENIWYFNKEVFFYEEAYKLENVEIINTYFKYINDLPYAYNEITGKYDIQADTSKYPAIVDASSLAQLIGIVQNAIEGHATSP